MNLARLYQPRNPAFWLMIALNLLSTVLAWIARSYELLPFAAVGVGALALVNAVLGIRLALGLMREPPRSAAADRRR